MTLRVICPFVHPNSDHHNRLSFNRDIEVGQQKQTIKRLLICSPGRQITPVQNSNYHSLNLQFDHKFQKFPRIMVNYRMIFTFTHIFQRSSQWNQPLLFMTRGPPLQCSLEPCQDDHNVISLPVLNLPGLKFHDFWMKQSSGISICPAFFNFHNLLIATILRE